MFESSVEKFGLIPGLDKEYEKETLKDDPNYCSNEEFTVKLGEETIEKIIKQWKVGDQWLYCIDYLGETDEEFDTIFTYRVLYSIPTRQKPIPRATASVYFNIKKSKVKPQTFPVSINYQLEKSRMSHSVNQFEFQEKWLYDILKSKAAFSELVKF